MQQYWIALLGTLLLWASCRKETQVELFLPGPQEHGFVRATKQTGGSEGEWAASGLALSLNSDTNTFQIVGITQDEYGQYREFLSLFSIPINNPVGFWTLQNYGTGNTPPAHASYSRRISDGDVIGAIYRVVEDDDSWVEILSIDTIANVVKGRFEAHFTVSPDYSDRGFPPEVHFTDGYFEVEIVR